MSFPILPQSSVVILEESSNGLYSITVYIILLLSLLSLEESERFIYEFLSLYTQVNYHIYRNQSRTKAAQSESVVLVFISSLQN